MSPVEEQWNSFPTGDVDEHYTRMGGILVPSPIDEPDPFIATILVAEDDVLIRLDLADLLRERGYRVLEAANADEALTLVRAADVSVDLLLTDLSMPGGVDGFTLVRVVRAEFPAVKLIVASALISDERDQGLKADAFFSKPIRFSRLLAKIEELLTKEL